MKHCIDCNKPIRSVSIRCVSCNNKHRHAISFVASDGVKKCTECKIEKPLSHFNKNTLMKDGYFRKCKKCVSAYRFKNREKINSGHKGYLIKHKYGITLEQKNQMVLDQEGRCGCCGDVLGIDPRNICLDHDHDKKRIRKILCRGCN